MDVNEQNENVVNENNNENKRKNRKRKKSFLQNARKYAKKGTYGRGSHLNEDTYQYFVNALELLRNGFESDEEKGIFVNNVLEQTINEEVNYSRNQIGCRLIESLLPFANDEILERYYKAFNDDLRPLLSDRFASHVIQALVRIAAFKGINYTTEQQDTIIGSSYQFATKISKFLLNNLEDFVWDTYGNHIIRTVLESLSGIFEIKVNNSKSTDFKDMEKSQLLPQFIEIVKEYGERLIQWPQFIDLPYEELTSGLIQILLSSLRKVDSKLMKRVLKKLLEDSFLGNEYKNYIENEKQPEDVISIYGKRLPPVFDSDPAIRLLEVVLANAKSKMYTKIYTKCFVNNLIQLAKTKSTNFTVQKLLNACTEKVEFEAIYDELSPEMENIFLSGHTGVILSLAQACKRLGTRQGQFTQNFMQSLHCNEPADKQINIVPLAIRMVPLERLQKVIESEKNINVNLHGSIIIQTMMEFNKPIKIINSLLNMDVDDLRKLFCDTKGCHIMDSFMASQFVGEKSREKLTRKLQGIYQDLASNKHGSRSFDALWTKTNLKQKHIIMVELCHKEAGWSNSEYGKIIASKLNIPLYKRNKDQWVASLHKVDKTKELFADIIDNV